MYPRTRSYSHEGTHAMPDPAANLLATLRSDKIFDTLSGTVVRLFARLQAVEGAVEKLAKQVAAISTHRVSEKPAELPLPGSGIDMYGSPEQLPAPKRSPGRPKGSRDTYQRVRPRRYNLGGEVSSHVVDRDLDAHWNK